jgi:aryl-alcohol dehydrogenase-like predicted oxidoreductase
MKTTTLGSTGVQVSRICYGAWQLAGDWGGLDERAAIGAIHHARSLGVNFFDTAAVYGWGASERLLGRALADDLRARREEIMLATKGGLRRLDDGSVVRDAGYAALRAGVEASLRNLGVEHIDIYQLHWPDPDTPPQESAAALGELVDEGKIRFAGLSNHGVDAMRAFAEVRPVDTLQPPYSLIQRAAEEDVLPYCEREGIGVFVYGPLAHGLLGGAMTTTTRFGDDDWRARSPLFDGEPFRRNLEVVGRLGELARELGSSVAQLAIAWVLAHPAVDAAIVGARHAEHVAANVQAAALELPGDVRARIDEIASAAAPVAEPFPRRRPVTAA